MLRAGALGLEVERTRDLFEGRVASSLGMRLGGKGGPMAVLDREEEHALAALCLYGQPFGFSREDVDLVTGEIIRVQMTIQAVGGPARATDELNERWERMSSLAARIAALLPPDGSVPERSEGQ